ncbi:hypothetical protein BDZ91DRAFT_763766 [Kalaharituber pfeilii]|nr:hypothetical protein BDZ91DRAFT_763766 [Kalaharituber pfeilii]
MPALNLLHYMLLPAFLFLITNFCLAQNATPTRFREPWEGVIWHPVSHTRYYNTGSIPVTSIEGGIRLRARGYTTLDSLPNFPFIGAFKPSMSRSGRMRELGRIYAQVSSLGAPSWEYDALANLPVGTKPDKRSP